MKTTYEERDALLADEIYKLRERIDTFIAHADENEAHGHAALYGRVWKHLDAAYDEMANGDPEEPHGEYVIDITAYDRVSTVKVKADSPDEAIRKACEQKNISVTIR